MIEKYVEIVKETEKSIIATIWTGANYYIDCFPKESIDYFVKLAEQQHDFITREDAIRTTHVADMLWLCSNEDFSNELLSETIQALMIAEKENAQ